MARKSKSKGKSKGEKGCDINASPCMPSDRRDISVRKISNGYIVSESGYRGGQYSSRETFTSTQPKVVVDKAKSKA
jgi:hypothetical protein